MQFEEPSSQRRENAGVILLWASSTLRSPIRKKVGDRVFSKAICDDTWGDGFKLKECRSRVGIRQKTFRMRMMRHSEGTAAPCACSLSGAPSASPHRQDNVQSVWEAGLWRPKTNCPWGKDSAAHSLPGQTALWGRHLSRAAVGERAFDLFNLLCWYLAKQFEFICSVQCSGNRVMAYMFPTKE